MFTTSTAFVLGAGASEPFGYPLGTRLLEGMMQDQFEMTAMLRDLGCEADTINDFRESLAWSGLNSIDTYLARVERHRDIGRLALAHQMLNYDSRGANFSLDWLGYVWRTLIEGVNTPDEFARNRLNIVTFNYDTSVERFITNALKYTFDLTLPRAIELARAIQIVHVYGSLPTLPVATKRISTITVDQKGVRAAAERIIVLHEGEDDSKEFQKAREVLLQSEVRLFLGFGYIEENVRRLRPAEWLRDGMQAPHSSFYGLSPGEIRRIQRLFPTSHSVTVRPGKCVDTVRDCVDLFTAPPRPPPGR